MGKRIADNQLTQLNFDDDEADAGDTGFSEGGFKLANEQALSQRVIRKPKSRLRGAGAESGAAAAPKPPSVFSGFSGFETTPTAGDEGSKFKGFSFSSQQKLADDGSDKMDEDKEEPKSTSLFNFGGKSGTSTGFTFGSTTATAEAAKQPDNKITFAAFKPPAVTAQQPGAFSPSTSSKKKPAFSMPMFVPPGDSSSTSGSVLTSKPEEKEPKSDDKDESFYRNIRGLNVSLQKKIADALETNPFVDLTPLLKQYRTHWTKIAGGEPQIFEDIHQNTKTKSTIKGPAFVDDYMPVFLGEARHQSDAELLASLAPKKDKKSKKPSIGSVVPPEEARNEDSTKKDETKLPSTSAFGASTGREPKKFTFNFTNPSATGNEESAKKPFSFGFGNNNNNTTETKPAGGASAFSFGFGKPVTTGKADNGDAEKKDEEMQAEDEVEEKASKEPTTAGEEDENTEYQTRAKVYKWDNEDQQFKDLGVGNLRINTNKTTESKRARMLCRQEGSDKITLNAAVFKEMKVDTMGKKDIGVLMVLDGKPTRYLIRVKNSEVAKELFDALEKVKDML